MNNNSCKMNKVFNSNVSGKWDFKEKIVCYHGYPNPITKQVIEKTEDKTSIIDIGCGTGMLINELDKKVHDCNIIGLDISRSMINNAKLKEYTGNNKISFICNDFIAEEFSELFDLIIMKNFLHHTTNPGDYLKKASSLLKENGRIFFSVPSVNYLKELFLSKELSGRFSINEIERILKRANLFPLSTNINRVAMTYNSYDECINYLKSIGTYAKVVDYSNRKWDDQFNRIVQNRFNEHDYITGEYLTYECINKDHVLTKTRGIK